MPTVQAGLATNSLHSAPGQVCAIGLLTMVGPGLKAMVAALAVGATQPPKMPTWLTLLTLRQYYRLVHS